MTKLNFNFDEALGAVANVQAAQAADPWDVTVTIHGKTVPAKRLSVAQWQSYFVDGTYGDTNKDYRALISELLSPEIEKSIKDDELQFVIRGLVAAYSAVVLPKKSALLGTMNANIQQQIAIQKSQAVSASS